MAVLVAGIAGAAWYFTRPKADAPAPVQTASAATTSAQTGTLIPVPATDTTATTATSATAPSTAIDPSLVDQEVQRRIAAERARLQAEAARAAQLQNTQTTAPPRPVPVPVQPVQNTQTAAPAPTPVETRPVPTPAVTQTQEPAPQPAETRTVAPEPAAPARRTFREGELVAAGTEGLTPPRILRRGTVAYPPVARMQRVEGTVTTSVLVSETGQVLDVRIIRGINRPVGLNEAAEQTMRRSSFAPGTVDGVRVRSWVTVPVEFKL
ncbi:MAG TPA: TonB family protein [Thermoanaerobaculia bacterium]|nr:TonB family protein [Thermoanaerobaculia bacterium]